MGSRRSSRWAHRPDVSLSAFLDLVLNILLFFVFATELAVTEALDVQIPQSGQAKVTTNENRPLIIFITKENDFVFDGAKVSLDELSERLKAKPPEDTGGVVIRGDRECDFQTVVSALDACQKAGVSKVRFEARQPPEKPAGKAGP